MGRSTERGGSAPFPARRFAPILPERPDGAERRAHRARQHLGGRRLARQALREKLHRRDLGVGRGGEQTARAHRRGEDGDRAASERQAFDARIGDAPARDDGAPAPAGRPAEDDQGLGPDHDVGEHHEGVPLRALAPRISGEAPGPKGPPHPRKTPLRTENRHHDDAAVKPRRIEARGELGRRARRGDLDASNGRDHAHARSRLGAHHHPGRDRPRRRRAVRPAPTRRQRDGDRPRLPGSDGDTAHPDTAHGKLDLHGGPGATEWGRAWPASCRTPARSRPAAPAAPRAPPR